MDSERKTNWLPGRENGTLLKRRMQRSSWITFVHYNTHHFNMHVQKKGHQQNERSEWKASGILINTKPNLKCGVKGHYEANKRRKWGRGPHIPVWIPSIVLHSPQNHWFKKTFTPRVVNGSEFQRSSSSQFLRGEDWRWEPMKVCIECWDILSSELQLLPSEIQNLFALSIIHCVLAMWDHNHLGAT